MATLPCVTAGMHVLSTSDPLSALPLLLLLVLVLVLCRARARARVSVGVVARAVAFHLQPRELKRWRRDPPLGHDLTLQELHHQLSRPRCREQQVVPVRRVLDDDVRAVGEARADLLHIAG